MSLIGIKLPILQSSTNGFEMISSIRGMIKQNFKMLILTIPGERVMEPNFGVGLAQFLFEGYNAGVEAQIIDRINSQVKLYLRMVSINDIIFGTDPDSNSLNIQITYSIPQLNLADSLSLTI
jgi:phage baseplate assembly protein W|tara:strand:- start:450 stop:815 length:366 start_codon:yes stop_codon:yes gene_type:complete